MRHAIRYADAAWAATLLLAAIAVGCGGGDDAPGACLSVFPAESPAAGRVVVRAGSGSGCDLQRVELVATTLTDLYSASFAAYYDPDIVRYEGYSVDGSVLASDGAQLQVLVTAEAGKVGVGVSRIETDQGVAVSGSRPVLALLFRRIGAVGETGALHFEDGALLGSETPPQPKPGITWYGAVFEVR